VFDDSESPEMLEQQVDGPGEIGVLTGSEFAAQPADQLGRREWRANEAFHHTGTERVQPVGVT
jgi:hypothetical protein